MTQKGNLSWEANIPVSVACESCPLLMIKTHYLVWTENTKNFKAWVEFWLWTGQWRMLFVQRILNSLFFPPHTSPFFPHNMKHPTSALELESTSAKGTNCQQFFGSSLIRRPQLGEYKESWERHVNSCLSLRHVKIHPETEWVGSAQER